MIIDDSHVKGIIIMPFKADSPLFVDTDCILSLSLTFQSVKHISWIYHQRIQAWCGVENHQSFSCLSLKGLESAHRPIVKELFGIFAGKRFYHMLKVLWIA